MGTLEIYGSRGQLLYPEDRRDPREPSGFTWKVFELNPHASNPYFEAYAVIEVSGEQKQTFVRYYYDDPSRMFEECRDAFREEIQQGQGWRALEPSEFDRSTPFWSLVVEDDVTAELTAEELLRNHDEFEQNWPALRQWLDDSDEPPLKLKAPHGMLGELIKTLSELDVSLVVSDRDRFVEAGDVEIAVSKGTEQIEVTTESEEYFASLVRNREEELLEEEYGRLEQALDALNDLDADRQAVSSRLNSGLKGTFPELEVTEKRRKVGTFGGGPAHGGSGRKGREAVKNERVPGEPAMEGAADDTADPYVDSWRGAEEHGGSGKVSGGHTPFLPLEYLLYGFIAVVLLFVAAVIGFGFTPDLGGGGAAQDFTMSVDGGENVRVLLNGTRETTFVVELFEGTNTTGTPLEDTVVSASETPISFDPGPGEYVIVAYPEGNSARNATESVTVDEPSPTPTASPTTSGPSPTPSPTASPTTSGPSPTPTATAPPAASGSSPTPTPSS